MEPPHHSAPQIVRVGIAVVIKHQQVLVGLRGLETDLPGFNEFPGGKCLPQESAAECAIRECKEETGLAVEIVETLNHRKHQYEQRKIDLTFFLCRPLNETEPATQAFNWIPIEQLETCQFPAGNHDVLQILKDRFKTSQKTASSNAHLQ